MPPDALKWLVKHTKERLDAAIESRDVVLANRDRRDYWNGYVASCERAYSDALDALNGSRGEMFDGSTKVEP